MKKKKTTATHHILLVLFSIKKYERQSLAENIINAPKKKKEKIKIQKPMKILI